MKYYILPLLFVGLLAGSFTTKISFEKNEPQQKRKHVPIPAEKITMYEVFVRNFSKEGTFRAVTSKLKYIKSLGANTLWLMPIQPTGKEKHKGTYGSPYAISDYTATNPDFGTKEDFKQLVDSCHALGLNIIIDLVANHTSWDNVWMKDHSDWYKHDSTGKIVSPVADWTDVAQLNFSNKAMRREMIKDALYWVRDFDIDGYRCDAAEMPPLDFWKDAIDSLNKIKHVVMLAEAADPKLYNSGFQITYGWDFYNTMKKVFKGDQPVTQLDSTLNNEKKKYLAHALQLRFITNHDEDSWDNVPDKNFGGIDGCKAAYVIMACIPGVPLIYNGQEVAYPEKINLFEKYTIDYNTHPELRKFYSTILALRNIIPSLRYGTMRSVNINDKDVYAFEREAGKDKMLIFVNVTGKETKYLKPTEISSTARVMLGEKLTSDATQVLPSYGFQLIRL